MHIEFACDTRVQRRKPHDARPARHHAFHVARFARGCHRDNLGGVVKRVLLVNHVVAEGEGVLAVGQAVYEECPRLVGIGRLLLAGTVHVVYGGPFEAKPGCAAYDTAREGPLGVFVVLGIGHGTARNESRHGKRRSKGCIDFNQVHKTP